MYKILLVDDDLALLESNRNYFVKRGYHVLCTDCAKQAMAMIETVTLDCVVLDIDLPDGDGFEVCARARETTSVPIVFLSAYTETECRVRGLSMGGDDYLCKPFSLEELELRVRLRIKRRDSGADEKVLRFGELTINSATRQVYVGTQHGDFSRIEFDVLLFLATHPGQVFSYEQLYDRVWKQPLVESRHNLQARVAGLRQKLVLLSPERIYIETIRNKGYRFLP